MKKKNPKEHQSPFEKYFYRHLNNVKISIMELNQSIKSRKKDNFQLENIPKIVEISKWQNLGDELKRGQTNISSTMREQQKQKIQRIVFLVLIWIVGITYIFREKSNENAYMNKLDWDKLVIKASGKNYTSINILFEDQKQLRQITFNEYCDIIKIKWLQELKPYFYFMIESQLNSIQKLNEGDTKEFSVFDQNSIFLHFAVSDIKWKNNIFSFQLKIYCLKYDFTELQQLSKIYLKKEIIDKQSANHFHLQQNLSVIKLLQNGIHDFL